jgi:hydroxypyruvate isomerase
MTRALKFSPNLNWLFTELPLENRPAAAAAAEAGFRAVECSRPYQLPAAQWRSRLHDAGVVQVLINTPTGPTNSATEFGAACLPGVRDEFRQIFAQALEYALAIDCPTINIMAGMQPGVGLLRMGRSRVFAAHLHRRRAELGTCRPPKRNSNHSMKEKTT